jgi:hypothetical protein
MNNDTAFDRAIRFLIILAVAIAIVGSFAIRARAAEPFSVHFTPLPPLSVALEATWQAENIIDLSQTLKLARAPQTWSEVGTLRIFCGSHPSTRQVWVGSIAFGIGHYAVSQLLANMNAPKTLVLWQALSLAGKTVNMQRNARNQLGY